MRHRAGVALTIKPTDTVPEQWRRSAEGHVGSECSTSCGKGFRRRNVTCVGRSGHPMVEENCLHLPLPRKQKSCKGGKCPEWRTSIWLESSVEFKGFLMSVR
ncbi:A disintegrin and metalloproteinase with thrombospondin motifs 9 isoform X3 [Tachysurus ichikawai]